MKIKLFSRTSIEELEQAVNQFIQDKNVVDIKYQSDRVLVIYKEDKIDVL